MSYFDYLKENVYKTYTKEIELVKNKFYVFDRNINIVKIIIPKCFVDCHLTLRTNTGRNYSTYIMLYESVIEYLNNFNYYLNDVKDLYLELDADCSINNNKIKIEYTYEKLYKQTSIKHYSSVIDKLRYTDKFYVLNKNIINDYRFKLIKKNDELSYLYEIDLDKLKDIDEDTNIISYINSILNNGKDLKLYFITLKIS
jgi:hypothetical protein